MNKGGIRIWVEVVGGKSGRWDNGLITSTCGGRGVRGKAVVQAYEVAQLIEVREGQTEEQATILL